MSSIRAVDADPTAQGRIKGARPVAVLDIGSNSVRLVVYERHARALTALYNEKASCALGRGMAKTGRLSDENVDRALTAIQRFALVARLMDADPVHVLATSAVRDAANGGAFCAGVEAFMHAPVRVLSGEEEAHFAALGVVAGMPGFAGVVGDLGGGSLELSGMDDGVDATGETLPLGVIRLQDDSGMDPAGAAAIARKRMRGSQTLEGPARTFCAIGGTWRSLAKLHQVQRDYPLHMVQHYAVEAGDLLNLCDELTGASDPGKIKGMAAISGSRRELLPYGGAVLGEAIRAGRFERVVFSALGVREGYLFHLLDEEQRALDPLIEGAREASLLRARSPAHADDLTAFTAGFFRATGIGETPEQARLREAACLLSDIGWRGHPDYRGEQSVDLVAYGSLTGVDHPGRAFLAEVLAVRYMGLKQKSVNEAIFRLAPQKLRARARLVGALFRVAYPMSAAMPGVLPRVTFARDGDTLVLRLPQDLGFLDGERLGNRLSQLAGVAELAGAEVRLK